MPNVDLGEILQKLSSSCTFPDASELEDNTCNICLHDSLGPQGPEIPTKLCCGHIFGMACLITWASDNHTATTTPSPSCPICRTPFFLPRTTQPSLQAIEADETTPEERGEWYMGLSSLHPGRPMFYPGEEWWINRAEHLWIHFCNAIYNHIDVPVDPTESENDLLREFLGEHLPVAQFILSYGTADNFFVAFHQSDPEFEEKLGIVREWIPGECGQLIRHFGIHNEVDSNHRWRIRQGCGLEFSARMSRRQSRLRLYLDRVSPEWRSYIN
ncbi:MAG: hypothetical protein Q9188_001982 [Gyalolechia gomerana]